MFLSNFSINRPIATLVIVLGLMCLGLLALSNLRVNEIPDVQQPVLVVQIAYPGAAPETVEREVINRIEKSLQSVTGVYEMRSTAKDSSAQFVIIFNFKKNMIEASDEVRNAIATVRYKLPVEMREPVLIRRRSELRSDHEPRAVVDAAVAGRNLPAGRGRSGRQAARCRRRRDSWR